MIEFFQQNWQTLLLGLVSAGLMAACRYIWKQMKKYRDLVDEEKKSHTEELIDEKLEPIYEDLEELRGFVLQMESAEKKSISLIVSSYKYRLV